jgi:hypothetical protein
MSIGDSTGVKIVQQDGKWMLPIPEDGLAGHISLIVAALLFMVAGYHYLTTNGLSWKKHRPMVPGWLPLAGHAHLISYLAQIVQVLQYQTGGLLGSIGLARHSNDHCLPRRPT